MQGRDAHAQEESESDIFDRALTIPNQYISESRSEEEDIEAKGEG